MSGESQPSGCVGTHCPGHGSMMTFPPVPAALGPAPVPVPPAPAPVLPAGVPVVLPLLLQLAAPRTAAIVNAATKIARIAGTYPAGGMQQKVEGTTAVTPPMGSPPLGWQAPGVYVGALDDLLPSAAPGARSWHSAPVEVIVAA